MNPRDIPPEAFHASGAEVQAIDFGYVRSPDQGRAIGDEQRQAPKAKRRTPEDIQEQAHDQHAQRRQHRWADHRPGEGGRHGKDRLGHAEAEDPER